MTDHPFDDPRILSMLFYPRPAQPGTSRIPNTYDGSISVDSAIRLGYRLYRPEQPRLVVVYFHGNGEVASDYDGIAPMYLALGAALLVVDFRGYGWSTGTPLTSRLLPDTEAILPALPDVLGDSLITLPRVVMGRSLGSGPALYLADRYADDFKGVVIESGFADAPSVFRRLGITIDIPTDDLPLNNVRRMEGISMPLLVIHGENDQLLPVTHGQRLFDASPSTEKTIVRIPRAGHNDLLFYGRDRYQDALSHFFQTVLQR